MRKSSAAVVMVALGAIAPLIANLVARADEPALRIAKQGSMEAGGRMINCATNDGGDPKSTRWPAGHVMVDNVYATYQYPAEMRHPHPILFNSGGGHTARVYDTTPDGREGWLTLFLREGFAVYGVDRPNTGRSGTDITRAAYFGPQFGSIETPVCARSEVGAQWRNGPLLIEEFDSTTVVPPDGRARLSNWDTIEIELA